MVLKVVENPAQKYNQEIDETVCQSKVNFDKKKYLLRVFVNFTEKPPVVISVYRTSKIQMRFAPFQPPLIPALSFRKSQCQVMLCVNLLHMIFSVSALSIFYGF